jgi:hypothetical protein
VTRKWLLCSFLILSLIPVLSSALPDFGAGYGGGGGSKTMTTTPSPSSTSQVTMVSATSVPEHIDLTIPLLTTVGLMVLFLKRRDAEPN